MSLHDILEQLFTRVSKPPQIEAYCAVLDSSNYTLIAIETYVPNASLLSESTLDTLYINAIPALKILPIKKEGPRTYPEWSWDFRTNSFTRTHPANVTEDMRERAVFTAKKGAAISQALYLINGLRNKLRTGLWFQEIIYATKEKQATMLKEANFDPALSDEASLVAQYAEECSLSLRDAAEDILLHAQLFHDHLEKTEKIRFALMRKIKHAKTSEQLDYLMEKFTKDGTM